MSSDAPEHVTVDDVDLVDDLSTPRASAPPTVERLDRLWDDTPGVAGFLTAVQNDAVGVRMMLTGFFFLLLGGSVDSFVMRLQLARPEQRPRRPAALQRAVHEPRLGDDVPRHPPDLRGLRDPDPADDARRPRDAVPRLGAFAYWTFLMGGLLYYSATLFQAVPERRVVRLHAAQRARSSRPTWTSTSGCSASAWPRSAPSPARSRSSSRVLKLRAPGHDARRASRCTPGRCWSPAFMILFAFTPLIVGSLLLELDRGFGMQFFDPDARRQLAAVAAPVLDLRPPRGLHPVPPGHRHRLDGRPGDGRAAGSPATRWMVAAMVGIGVPVVRAVGPPHVHRRSARRDPRLLRRRQHDDRDPGRRPDLLLDRHDLGRAAAVATRRSCSSSASSSSSSSAASPA